MHKVIKILGKTALSLILLVLFSPFVLSLLLAMPGVQNYVADQAARFVSRHLQTTVDIGHIDIGAGGRIRIKDFYVEDYRQDTLLYVKQLDAIFPNFRLDGQGLNFSSTVAHGAKLYLRETETGEMNIRQVVRRLANPNREKRGEFHLSMADLQVEDMTLSIERLEHRNPEYGVDYGNMRFENIAAQMRDFTITPSLIFADVQAFSFREQSGFRLENLSGNFSLNNGLVSFGQLHLQMPHSSLDVSQLLLSGSSWQAYKNFISEVTMKIEMDDESGYVSTEDIAYFSPSMRHWQLDFKMPRLNFEGRVNDFYVTIDRLHFGEHAGIVLPMGHVQGLPEFSTARFMLHILTFNFRPSDLFEMARNIGGVTFSPSARQMLIRTGNVGMRNITFDGSLSDFTTRLEVHRSNVGSLTAQATIKPLNEADSETADAQPYRSLTASVQSPHFEVGRLFAQEAKLGSAALSAQLNGVVEHGLNTAQVNLDVTDLHFNGYRYDSLHLDGRLRHRGIDGQLAIVDPHIRSQVDGEVQWLDSIPRYDVTGRINHLDLNRLNFNRRDTVAQLSGRFSAKGRGRSLDELNGTIQLHDVVYRYNNTKIESNVLSLSGQNSVHRKQIQLHSDFVDAVFTSRSSYRVIFDYLRRSANRYLPLLREENAALEPLDTAAATEGAYSTLEIKIKDFKDIAQALRKGLEVANGSELSLTFDPVSDHLRFMLKSEYVQYENQSRALATGLHLSANNDGDSLRVNGRVDRLLYGRNNELPNLQFSAGAKLGRLALQAGFNDPENDLMAQINLGARITRPAAVRSPHVEVKLGQSMLVRGDEMWELSGDHIALDSTRLRIGQFEIRNGNQRLLVDGVASRLETDSLHLHLHDFEIAPVLAFSNRMGYRIGGRMQGEAMMTAVLDHGVMSADLAIDSLSANDLVAPPLKLTVEWDAERNRADIGVRNEKNRRSLATGFYAPRDKRYGAHLTIDSLDMALLDPLLEGVISESRGAATVDMTIEGEGAEPKIEGEIRVREFGTKIDYTQVYYHLPEATIRVKESLFATEGDVALYDREGNRGKFSLNLDLQHLSNIGYALHLQPEQMLVLDTERKDNAMFYGRVFATGDATIRGSKGEVTMDLKATTNDHSMFSLPMAETNTISSANFISFAEPVKEETVDLKTEKVRQFILRNDEQEAASNRMKITLELNVQPNVELQMMVADSPIKARGNGQLNMTIEPQVGKFDLQGTYVISEGTYAFSVQNLISKNFVIGENSSIQWNGDPMDAMLDINAVYTVRTSLQPLLEGMTENSPVDRSTPVECCIHLADRLTNPTITFDVVVPDADPETKALIATVLNSPEAVNMQFLYLFVLGSFMADNSLTASTNNPGAMTSTATGVQFLTNQLSRLLSFSDYNVVIRYRPKTEIASDELDFGLSKSLINNRLLVEVEGNYLLDEKLAANNSMSNFMGEAYVTYLIDRSGALRLRAFTQTINRFDENQGLQETGVGVYYKEDFENLRDLSHRIKERFTSKRRREKRAARARAAALAQQNQAAVQSPAAEPKDAELKDAGIEMPDTVTIQAVLPTDRRVTPPTGQTSSERERPTAAVVMTATETKQGEE